MNDSDRLDLCGVGETRESVRAKRGGDRGEEEIPLPGLPQDLGQGLVVFVAEDVGEGGPATRADKAVLPRRIEISKDVSASRTDGTSIDDLRKGRLDARALPGTGMGQDRSVVLAARAPEEAPLIAADDAAGAGIVDQPAVVSLDDIGRPNGRHDAPSPRTGPQPVWERPADGGEARVRHAHLPSALLERAEA